MHNQCWDREFRGLIMNQNRILAVLNLASASHMNYNMTKALWHYRQLLQTAESGARGIPTTLRLCQEYVHVMGLVSQVDHSATPPFEELYLLSTPVHLLEAAAETLQKKVDAVWLRDEHVKLLQDWTVRAKQLLSGS